MSKHTLKETFEVDSKHEAFYTGGNICWSADGDYLFCQNRSTVSVVSVSKGLIIAVLGTCKDDEEEDTLQCFTVSHDDVNVVTHHKSGLFKLWNWKDRKVIKLWKSIHKGPVARVAFMNGDNILASGGSDGNIRLWDLQHHTCIRNFRQVQGVVSVLAFHPDNDKRLLFAAGDDAKIHGWNINTNNEVLLLSAHFSKVTSLAFHEDGRHLISAGRDRVLVLWDITTGSSIRVLPIYEGAEGIFIVPSTISLPVNDSKREESSIYVAAAGEKGLVQIWEIRAGRLLYSQENSLILPAKEEGSLSITHLLYNSTKNCFAAVSIDHNIIVHSLSTFECKKQLVGYTDEILDIVYVGDNGTHLALATNSRDIKLYELATMNCQLLCGHSDIVLALSTTPVNPHLLISSAKDNSVRIWLMNEKTLKMTCIASAVRHTASVGSTAISQVSLKFFASISQDLCLKLWELPETLTQDSESFTLNVVHTVMAHKKDINCVTISPNDKLIATASQDKTAKLWSATDLQLLGVLHGHRRGVWCVRFSPIDQVLLTTSADCTVKLWSLSELNCLKTLEGHESSVLRAEFMSRGMQLITSGADGLLKVWSIKTSECFCTLDQHEDRVWTIAVSNDEKRIISGGSDSLLVVWRDVTAEKKATAAAKEEQLTLKAQKLANLVKANNLNAALRLALKLERPLQILKIIEGIMKNSNFTLKDSISSLKAVHKEKLLLYAVTWNTNSRNAQAAQMVIKALITDIESEELKITDISSTLEAMIPYTERHFKRMTRLMQDLQLLTYTLNCMKPHITAINTI